MPAWYSLNNNSRTAPSERTRPHMVAPQNTAPLSVCVVHNHYQQPGGEDQVVANEVQLLESHGHQVTQFTMHNDAVDQMSLLQLAGKTVWNPTTYQHLRAHLQDVHPDIVHVHNTLPLLSPSVYYAARREGCAVVQTLHNYRLLCPAALLYRDGQICEDCVGRSFAWPGIAHGCYRQSRSATSVVATMLAVHRAANTWTEAVDAYIALTPFARTLFVRGGLPDDKLSVKPNFIAPDPGMGTGDGRYALFVGRLSAEKGIQTVLDAWQDFPIELPLKIVGDGPLVHPVQGAASASPTIEWLGRRSHNDVLDLMRAATVLVFSSTWYEGLPMTLLEAQATGLPVVASNLGAMATLVQHNVTGRLFQPGNAGDLAHQMIWMQRHPKAWDAMRTAARAIYEGHYTPSHNYELLLKVYHEALQQATQRIHRAERPPSAPKSSSKEVPV